MPRGVANFERVASVLVGVDAKNGLKWDREDVRVRDLDEVLGPSRRAIPPRYLWILVKYLWIFCRYL